MKSFGIPLYVFIATMLCSCAIQVHQLNPEPVIHADFGGSLHLILSDEIRDSFKVKTEVMKTMQVQNWRTSLEAGFINGFEAEHAIADTKDAAKYVIEIEKAAPVHQLIDHSQLLCITKIAYVAHLLDSKGVMLKSSSGTVYSQDTPYRVWEFSGSLEGTIEEMYSVIADDFFGE